MYEGVTRIDTSLIRQLRRDGNFYEAEMALQAYHKNRLSERKNDKRLYINERQRIKYFIKKKEAVKNVNDMGL